MIYNILKLLKQSLYGVSMKWLNIYMHIFVCMGMMLTVVCLEGLGLDYLTTVAAHHQVEVVLCGTLAEYGHVCTREE